MEIRDIESVCAVDIYRNYSNAAYNTATSTAVISKHVAKAEKELGIRIFERASKTRPVELTEAGAQIIDYMHAIVRMYRCAVKTAESVRVKQNDVLTVGYMPRVGNFRENEILARFAFDNPNIMLYRKTDCTEGLVNMLLSGVADMVLVPFLESPDESSLLHNQIVSDDIEIFEVLHNDVLTVGVPDGHPLANAEMITKDMYKLLHGDTFLLSNDQKTLKHEASDGYLYELFGFTGNMKIRYIDVTEPTISLELVKRGAGVLVQSGITQRHMGGINFIPVEGWDKRATLYCIYRKSAVSPGLKKLADCVKRFSEEYNKRKDG